MGLPGSGKSTYVNTHFSGAVVVSGDQLKTSKKVLEICEFYIQQNQFFVVDATNLTLERRTPLIDLCKKYLYFCMGVYISTDPNTCIERIAERVAAGGTKVSRVAVYALNKKKVLPNVEEGFGFLLTV